MVQFRKVKGGYGGKGHIRRMYVVAQLLICVFMRVTNTVVYSMYNCTCIWDMGELEGGRKGARATDVDAENIE